MKKFSTRELVYMSLLIALNIVLTRIASIRINIGGVEGIRIGFGGLPIIFAGIVLSPMAGGIVGAIGDLIGYYINPIGPYLPCFTLNAALTGLIPGLLLSPFKQSELTFGKLFMAIGIGQIVTSIILWTYFMNLFFKLPIAVLLPSRIMGQIINIPLYVFMIKTILRKINTVLNPDLR